MNADETANSIEKTCRISVVIPVLNEADRINVFLEKIRSKSPAPSLQVIVVDGDQKGSTINAIIDDDILKITAPKGRASQMNAAAEHADGDVILFLHADTELPEGAFKSIDRVMKTGRYVGGAFDLGVDSDRVAIRFIAACSRSRNRMLATPFGDQAIFIDKKYFDNIGRFRDIKFLEDIDLMRRIKKDRRKIYILKDRVTTSARRWETEGVIYATLRNQLVLMLYYLGVSPDRLAGLYRSSYGKHRKKNT